MNTQYAISAFAYIAGLEAMIRAAQYSSSVVEQQIAQQISAAEIISGVEKRFESASPTTRLTGVGFLKG